MSVGPSASGGRLVWLLIATVLCVGFAAYAFHLGQDVNFDQLNYHTYSAYAVLNGRIDTDAAPAQIIHSFFSPYVYVPYFLLLYKIGPVAATVFSGAIHGLCFTLILAIANAVCSLQARRMRWAWVGLAFVISIVSPMALSEVGTSYVDVVSALPLLCGLALLLRPGAGNGSVALAGLGAGMAVALKLTNATFAIALVFALLVTSGSLMKGVTSAARFSVCAAAGFLLFGASWCWTLWTRFHNPAFPYWNNIFRSPDFAPEAFTDRRYLPSGPIEALAYPFRWMAGIVPTAEVAFRDIRFGIIIGLLVCVAVTAMLRILFRRRATGQPSRREATLVVFWVASLVIWFPLFSIQRYIVVAELLCGPVSLILIGWIFHGLSQLIPGAVFAVAVAATVIVPSWGRVAYLPGFYGLKLPEAFVSDGLYFMAGEPVSYVIPALPADARFFGVMWWENTAANANTVFTRRMQAAVAQADGRPIFVVANAPLNLGTRTRLGSYGLTLTDECGQVSGYSDTGVLMICKLQAGSEKGPAAAPGLAGATIDFSGNAGGFPMLFNGQDGGWSLPGPTAHLTPGRTPGILFRVPDSLRSRAVTLGFAVRVEALGGTGGLMRMRTNDQASEAVLTPSDRGTGIYDFRVCVRGTEIPQDGTFALSFVGLTPKAVTPPAQQIQTFRLLLMKIEYAPGPGC